MLSDSKDLYGIIVRHYPQLRIDEIGLIFEKGLLKHFGEYYGLSTSTFCDWIKKYLSSPERAEKQRKERMYLSQKTGPSEEEINEMMIAGVKREYKNFKEFGETQDRLNAIYDFLDKRGFIKYTAKEKKSFIEQAKEKLLKEQHDKKLTSSILLKREIEKAIQGIKSTNKIVISEAKNMVLTDFFFGITDEEFNKLLNNLKI